MKFVIGIVVLISLMIGLQAGKVVWKEDGTTKITGTSGKGCTENSILIVKESNTTKTKCR